MLLNHVTGFKSPLMHPSTHRPASAVLARTFELPVDRVQFGANPSFNRYKKQVFKEIEPCIPVHVECDEAEGMATEELLRRKKERFDTWLNQFQPRDRRMALTFLEKLRYIDHPRLLGHLRNSHQKLIQALHQDGFAEAELKNSLPNVDFTTLYKASSGDLVSYLYRKANKIPKVQFYDQSTLALDGKDKSNRALVIVDDYLATGTQFFCEALGHGDTLEHGQNKYLPELFRQYKKVYFVVAGVNEKGLDRFGKLREGRTREAVRDILDGFQDSGNERYEGPVRAKLQALGKDSLQLIYSFVEYPMLSERNEQTTREERERLKQFLTSYNVYKYPFDVGNSQGNTVFYYSTPNNLPDLLWNSKSRQLNPDGTPDKSRPWLPLFHRLEDVSAYWFVQEKNVPSEHQLW